MKRLGTIASALLIALGITIGAAAPASAAQNTLKICLSSESDGRVIRAWDTDTNYEWFIEAGNCHTQWNDNDNARVNVNPFYIGVRSYKIGVIGQGYGPCHDHSSNTASNPPNNAPDGVRYRTYFTVDCVDTR